MGAVAAALVATLALPLAVGPASATTLLQQLSLEDVTAQADRIVHGTVADVHSGRDERGLPATWVTFEVDRRLKGNVASRVTIKQLGASAPLADGSILQVTSMPRFAVGDDVVVFLHADSARGFTSPVGLAQGVYHFDRTDAGLAMRGARTRTRSIDDFLGEVARILARDK